MKRDQSRGEGGRFRDKRGRGHHASQPDILVQALAQVLELSAPADGVLHRFFRAHAQMGRRDRGLVAETVFDVLRNRRRYAHLADSGSGLLARRLALLSLVLRGEPQPSSALLAPPNADEQAWLTRAGRVSPDALPEPVRFSMPDWLFEHLSRSACGLPRDEHERARLAVSLLEPAGLHLRVNTLKASPEAAMASLTQDGIDVQPVTWLPGALSVQGRPALERSQAFLEGWVEVQDAGSQTLAALVGARRGQTVIDLCAGAGGKTLALAAAMRSLGQVFAVDVSVTRLQRMRPRLLRSGATNVQPLAIDSLKDQRLRKLAARGDAVLVDAPCTGSGTLKRNPELKWRMQPADLERLVLEQRSILAAAAGLVKPGGVLVYGTCSLIAEENAGNVRWFEEAFPAFQREPADATLASYGITLAADAFCEGMLALSPERHGSDGFFGVRWRRDAG